MKRLLLLSVLLLAAPAARGQDSINPYNTQLPNTIELHNTDVYYCPFAPPALTDTSWQLSSLSNMLLDSNGLFDTWPGYEPKTHDTLLKNWAPCGGAPLGIGAHWQRFFTAKRDGLGNTHDIIAGGNPGDRVIISKNEDVDFRASGTIKLKNGFHAMPGCRFHAYTEPKYDSVVFSDDFDSTAISRTKWYIANGNGDGYGILPSCSADSNVRDTLDPDATDGHALDIFIREVTDTCSCRNMDYQDNDSCNGTAQKPPDTSHTFFSSAIVRACPFPYISKDALPIIPAYQQEPYGKYEIREKIPHLVLHNNNWISSSFEVDMSETTQASPPLDFVFPNLHQNLRYGPFKGVFHKVWDGLGTGYGLIDSVIFVSRDADWSPVNAPHILLINNFPYEVALDWNLGSQHDTVRMDPRSIGYMGWPTSQVSDTIDSVEFYYERYGGNQADSTTWVVKQDSHGTWRKFYATYHDSSGTLFHFSKAYQPTSVYFTYDHANDHKWFNCHWEYNLNNPIDSGIIYLDDTLSPSDLHSNTEAYQYNVNENVVAMPAAALDMSDTLGDYTYHTFGVEILPHEIRYLIDSNVVARLPDRMLPPGVPGYNFNLERAPLDFHLAQLDFDGNDPFGLDPTSVTYAEKQYFEGHLTNPGFHNVTVGGVTYHAAHNLVDYVRVWDVPKDVIVPSYPH